MCINQFRKPSLEGGGPSCSPDHESRGGALRGEEFQKIPLPDEKPELVAASHRDMREGRCCEDTEETRAVRQSVFNSPSAADGGFERPNSCEAPDFEVLLERQTDAAWALLPELAIHGIKRALEQEKDGRMRKRLRKDLRLAELPPDLQPSDERSETETILNLLRRNAAAARAKYEADKIREREKRETE